MILRVNQIDPLDAERQSGWAPHGWAGSLASAWPPGTQAYELLILPDNDQADRLDQSFRQAQLRQLLPEVLAALRDGRETIARLDGPLAAGELLAAMKWLGEPAAIYGGSILRKPRSPANTPAASLRLHLDAAGLRMICAEPALGLDRQVRLRVFAVEPELVDEVLDIDAPDDSRWAGVLRRAHLVVGTAQGLGALHAFTRQMGPADVRQRLISHLAPT